MNVKLFPLNKTRGVQCVDSNAFLSCRLCAAYAKTDVLPYSFYGFNRVPEEGINIYAGISGNAPEAGVILT